MKRLISLILLLVIIVTLSVGCNNKVQDKSAENKKDEIVETTLDNNNQKDVNITKYSNIIGPDFSKGIKIELEDGKSLNITENEKIEINYVNYRTRFGIQLMVFLIVNDNSKLLLTNIDESDLLDYSFIREVDNVELWGNKEESEVVAVVNIDGNKYKISGDVYREGSTLESEELNIDVLLDSVNEVLNNIKENADTTNIPTIYEYTKEILLGDSIIKEDVNLIAVTMAHYSIMNFNTLDLYGEGFNYHLQIQLKLAYEDISSLNLSDVKILGLPTYVLDNKTLYIGQGEEIYKIQTFSEGNVIDNIDYFFTNKNK